jgi:ABC-2 type transport system ATP-binding protein
MSANDVDTVIQASGLTKRYGAREVVSNLTFGVRRGEILGMLGPNGAGKTTTLRMLVGLVRPNAGSVSIQGYSLQNDRARALASVGAIIEEAHFYPYLTALDNLGQVARMRALPAGRKDLVTWLDRVGLADAADRTVRQYSLGMRQRLALAAALMVDPDVLIMDEPMNGLDPAAIKDLRDRLRALASEGVSMVLSSHLLGEVEQLCDRVILIDHGRLIGDEAVTADAVGTAVAVRFRVADASRAEAVLQEGGFPVQRLGDGEVLATVDPGAVPHAVAALVAAHVDIFAVIPERDSLETRYLARTGQGREGVSL